MVWGLMEIRVMPWSLSTLSLSMVMLSEQFGVDVDSRENLIAANHSLEEMREILGVDSLGFLSVDGVKKIAEGCKCGLCTGCFTGKYPVEPPKSTEKSKFEKKISENIND